MKRKIVRWLGAYGTGPDFVQSLQFEMGQQARPVSGTVIWDHQNRQDAGYKVPGGIGLIVNTRGTELIAGFNSDVWSVYNGGDYLSFNRASNADKVIRSWKNLNRLAGRRTGNSVNSRYCEVIFKNPDYVGILVKPGSDNRVWDLAYKASKITGLPVISWKTGRRHGRGASQSLSAVVKNSVDTTTTTPGKNNPAGDAGDTARQPAFNGRLVCKHCWHRNSVPAVAPAGFTFTALTGVGKNRVILIAGDSLIGKQGPVNNNDAAALLPLVWGWVPTPF